LVSVSRRRFVRHSAVIAAVLGVRPLETLAELEQKSDAGERSRAPLDALAIRKLAAKTTGRVITPATSEYESSRLLFNRAFDKRPALILRCAGAADIARALEFAQQHTLPVAVRGGGHNRAGLSVCDGGMVIDLAAMNRIEVNPARRVVRAGAGALTVHVDAATQRHGLATTLAGCPTVGIAGLTLGGGEGFLMSKYGAACDNLISARVVTVDGTQVRASETSNPDLFWAIRGGGGNFGVATALEYQLHPVSDVLAGWLAYSAGQVSRPLEGFATVIASAPDEFNIVGSVSASALGPQFRMLLCHCGEPRQGNAVLSPMRALHPQEDTVRVASYLEINATVNPASPVAHFQTDLFVPELDAGVIATISAAIESAPLNARVFMVPFYGAVTRVGPSDTAFPLRRVGCELDIMARWESPSEKDAAVRWVKELRDKLSAFAQGAYVNQLGETSEQLVQLAYGANYPRLAAIKKKYDPTNVLQSNQNISPA